MKESIEQFWNQQHFAVVGASRRRDKFGNLVFREMKRAGYDVVPINRNRIPVEKCESYATVKDVGRPLDAALLVISPEETEGALRQCADNGIRHVWIQKGAESERAIALGDELGLNVIHHECALMFLTPTRFPHSLHKWTHIHLNKHHRE